MLEKLDPEGRRPLGRHRQRWEGHMRMDLRETGWKVVEWIHLAQDRDQRREHGEGAEFPDWV